jgi:hypothetical protein
MRIINSNALAKVEQQFGTEPINIIEVQWVDGGTPIPYADKDLENIKGRILDLSNLDFIIDVNDGSDSTQISVILSDVDGTLKDIIDNHDVHKRDVWVYQWFEGMDLDDKFLLFRGQINSPLVWNEGDRTLSFDVISQIEDAEIGFSIEEGRMYNYDRNLIGKTWPLKFGTTINVPALRATEVFKGTLGTGTGISDFWIPYKLQQTLTCPLVFIGAGGNGRIFSNIFGPDPACSIRRCQIMRELELQLTEQRRYEFDTLQIIDGDRFPQGTSITLNIGGGKFTGIMSGTTFTITSRRHPDFAELGPPTVNKHTEIMMASEEGVRLGCGQPGEGNFFLSPSYFVQGGDRDLVRLSEVSFNRFNAIPSPGFFWAAAGTEVTLDLGQETVYLSNLVPETVIKVMAYRQLDNQRRLITVPPEFYTVRTSDFNSYTISEIVFSRPMSEVDSTWEDDIYVTSTSSVGPNTVDIMEWLINKYTNLSIDATSFNSVKALLAEYPMDFPYLTRKNVLTALRELAFQARCAIYLRNGTFYLKYLPVLAASVDEITADDVDANSIELYHSSTEGLVTKFVSEWKRDYSKDEPNTAIFRHNVERYGVQEQVFDFYAFNELDYIIKSSTFWMIRKANTWRNIRFSTPLQKLALETFDTIDITLPTVNAGTIPGIVKKADYNSNSKMLEFDVWTPVKSGTQTVYDFAHPAEMDPELFWPTDEEFAAGAAGSGISAPGFSVIAPAGHPLAPPQGVAVSVAACPSQNSFSGPGFFAGSAFNNLRDRGCGNDQGDGSPSDEGDEAVDKNIEDSTSPDAGVPPGDVYQTEGAKLAEVGATEDRLTKAEQTANDAYAQSLSAKQEASNANEAAGGEGSAAANPDPGVGNLPTIEELEELGANEQDGSECLYFANVFIHQATFVGGPDGGNQPGDTGFIGTSSQVRVDRMAFRTCIEAQRFVCGVIKGYQARQAAQNIQVSEQLPVNANSVCPLYNPPCETEPDGPVPTIIGYTAEPSGGGFEDLGDTSYVDAALEFAELGEC